MRVSWILFTLSKYHIQQGLSASFIFRPIIAHVCGAFKSVCLISLFNQCGYWYLTSNRFQQNLVMYQNFITKSMYDKQLDSGKGTLLHLCDDVIQQEVSNILTCFVSLHFFNFVNYFEWISRDNFVNLFGHCLK